MSSPRTSALSPSMRKTGPQMKRLLRYEVYEQELDGLELSYCLCEKLNASGLLYNQRFLCIAQGDFISYGRGIEQTATIPFKNFNDVPIKTKVIIQDIVSFEIGEKEDDRWLKIEYKSSKNTTIWQFRLGSRLMCMKWKSRMEDSNQKYHRKKFQKPMEITRNQNEFDLSMYVAPSLKVSNPKEQLAYSQIIPQVISEIKYQQSTLKIPEKQIEKQTTITLPKQRQKEKERDKQKEIEKQLEKEKTILDERLFELNNLNRQIEKSKNVENELIEQYSELDWQDEFLNTHDYPEKIKQFNEYCEAIAVRLIDELLIPELSRTYKPIVVSQYSFEYDFDGFFIRLCWPLPLQQDIKVNPAEVSYREMKAFEYILTKTQNKSSLKVPLTTIVHYKGLTVYFKTKHRYQRSKKIQANLLQKALQQFSKTTNIDVQVLLSKHECIFPLQENTFLLQDANNILPLDPYHHPYQILPYLFRKIMRYKRKQNQQYSLNETSQLNMSRINKIDSKIEQLEVSSKISNVLLQQIVEELESSIEKLVSPQDFMRILNQYGSSFADLGRIYKTATLPFVKIFVTSMIYLNAFSRVYRYRLSCQIKALPNKKISLIQKQSHLLGYSLGLVNKVLFGDKDNDQIWRCMQSVIKSQFKLLFTEQNEYNETIFKNGVLEFASGVKFVIDYSVPLLSSITRKEIVKFTSKIQSLDAAWTPFYVEIKELIDEQEASDNSLNRIISMFSLKSRKLPKHVCYCSFYDDIRVYLSNCISSLSPEFEHLKLYNSSAKSIPQWINYYLMQRDFVWLMKGKKEREANNVKFKFMSLLTLWCGQDHPLHLNILSAEHNEFLETSPDDAIRIGKNLLKRALKYENIIGEIKISQCYYGLAHTYLSLGHFSEALSHFSRCKSIIEQKSEKNGDYYQLCLVLSKLYLHENTLQLCIEHILLCFQYYEFKSKCQDELTQCLQILYRYHLLTQKYSVIYEVCESKLSWLKKDSNLQKIIRILTQITICKIDLKVRMELISHWRKEESQKGFSLKARCNEALENLRQLITKNIFVKTLELINDKGEVFLKQLLEVKRLPKWTELISEVDSDEEQSLFFLQSIYYFLDEGWILIS